MIDFICLKRQDVRLVVQRCMHGRYDFGACAARQWCIGSLRMILAALIILNCDWGGGMSQKTHEEAGGAGGGPHEAPPRALPPPHPPQRGWAGVWGGARSSCA